MENHAHSARLDVFDNSNNGYYISMGILMILGILTFISLFFGNKKND